MVDHALGAETLGYNTIRMDLDGICTGSINIANSLLGLPGASTMKPPYFNLGTSRVALARASAI